MTLSIASVQRLLLPNLELLTSRTNLPFLVKLVSEKRAIFESLSYVVDDVLGRIVRDKKAVAVEIAGGDGDSRLVNHFPLGVCMPKRFFVVALLEKKDSEVS